MWYGEKRIGVSELSELASATVPRYVTDVGHEMKPTHRVGNLVLTGSDLRDRPDVP